MYKAGTPLIEVQAYAASLLDIDAQDAQVVKLWKLITSAYKALRTISLDDGSRKSEHQNLTVLVW